MGYLKIILAILIWSSLGIIVRKAGLPTQGIVFYPALLAAIFQSIILYKKGGLSLPALRGSNIILYILAPCFLANTFLYYYAFAHTTIANAVLTHYTAPIFVAIMAPLLLKEKSANTTWLAIVLSSIGLWLMLGGFSVADEDLKGIIAGIASGVVYAVIILLVRAISQKYTSLFVVFVQNMVAAFILLPFVIKIPLTYQSLPYLVALGLIHSTLAPVLYLDGLKTVRANEAAILGYFEPVGAIILALIFLNEIPGAKALLGGLLILCSGYMIFRGRG
ncbi:MAG: EamA family transporter [Nitrospirae bacterium]|nr:EamA family transporter [Nitrospirota bacterium]